jgi:putative sugar O-methyltransferase
VTVEDDHTVTHEIAGMPLAEKWADLVAGEGARLRKPTGEIDLDLLRHFRRNAVFVLDHYPYTDYADLHPRHWWRRWLREPLAGTRAWLAERFVGSNRVERRFISDAIALIQAEGGGDLLDKYATRPAPGDPRVMHHGRHLVNRRFVRHLYFLNLFRSHLGEELRSGLVCLDLGCSYGAVSSLVKREFPATRHVLVDFGDQLVLARYFLGELFPDAKIALVDGEGPIGRDVVEANDFTLVPVESFEQLEPGTVDLFSNFLSLGEMTKQWFTHYIDSGLFQAARYLVTSNRFVSGPRLDPTYPTGLTVLDYPLADFEPLLFDINPMSTRLATDRLLVLGGERHASSQYFDFVGRRIDR